MRLLSRWSALALLLFVLYPAVFAAHSAWALEGDQEIRQDVGDDRLYGIGVFIIDQNGQIVVERSMEGSPAYKAGIRPGDVAGFVIAQFAGMLVALVVANVLNERPLEKT